MIMLSGCVLLLLACTTVKKIEDTGKIVVTGDEQQKGRLLIAGSDCFTCHSIEKEQIGPAYSVISLRYRATSVNIEKLADKIINGGEGNWGKIPMTPHTAMPKEDAKTMVKFILTLKK